MQLNKIYVNLCTCFATFVFVLAIHAQDKNERRFQGSNATRAVISSNSVYFSTSDKESLPGILKVDLATGNLQIIKLLLGFPPEETLPFRIKNNSLYAISMLILGGGPQRIFGLETFALDDLAQQDDGSLAPPIVKVEDLDKRRVIGIKPLEIGLHMSYSMLKFNYDFVIHPNDSITLYILRGNTLEIWDHSGLSKTNWKKNTQFQTDWSDAFSILEREGESIVLTASGDIYNLNGKVLSKLTEQKAKLTKPEDRDVEDPIFIENQDSGEHWIVTTKKSADGTITLSKSRSLKAGKIEDVSLPNNIAAALNTALKVKAKDTPKK